MLYDTPCKTAVAVRSGGQHSICFHRVHRVHLTTSLVCVCKCASSVLFWLRVYNASLTRCTEHLGVGRGSSWTGRVVTKLARKREETRGTPRLLPSPAPPLLQHTTQAGLLLLISPLEFHRSASAWASPTSSVIPMGVGSPSWLVVPMRVAARVQQKSNASSFSPSLPLSVPLRVSGVYLESLPPG